MPYKNFKYVAPMQSPLLNQMYNDVIEEWN